MKKAVAKLIKRISRATGANERALKRLWYETPVRVAGRRLRWVVGPREKAPNDGRLILDVPVPGHEEVAVWRIRDRKRSRKALLADAQYYEKVRRQRG